MSIMSLEDIIKDKLKESKQGELLNDLFSIACELRLITNVEEVENELTVAALNYVGDNQYDDVYFHDRIYTAIRNVFYVLEVYIRGDKESGQNIKYLEVIELLKGKKARNLIDVASEYWERRTKKLRNRLSKCTDIVKQRQKSGAYKVPVAFVNDVSYAIMHMRKFPSTRMYIGEIELTKYYPMCVPVGLENKTKGIYNIEVAIEQMLTEFRILNVFDPHSIDKHLRNYKQQMHMPIFEGNLFELVIKNFLFALPFSINPHSLVIKEFDATNVASEIFRGKMTAEELINETIGKFEFTGRKEEYMKNFESILQKRIDFATEKKVIGELFIVTPSGGRG